MQAWLLATILLIACVAPLAPTLAQGQNKTSREPATVSAASLRVPDKARQHLEKARAAVVAGRREEGALEIQKALDLYPDYANAYLLRAVQEADSHRYDAAIADALTAKQKDPVIAWVNIVLAQAYSGLGRYRDALLILDAIRGPEAESWQAYYERTRAAVGQGDVENALRWSQSILETVPANRIEAHLLRACALRIAHRWTEAQAELAIYLNSSQPQPQRMQALAALEEIGKNTRANEPVVASK